MDFNLGQLRCGRPSHDSVRDPMETACYDFLDRLHVAYHRVDHAAAFHIAACHQVETILGAPIAKNLFLCNRQKTQFYLLLPGGDKKFKTKYLSAQLGCSRLSFAEPEDFTLLLGVQPGSASLLCLLQDQGQAIQLVLDRPLLQLDFWGLHPCRNTSTLRIATTDILEQVIPALGHRPIWVDLPEEDL